MKAGRENIRILVKIFVTIYGAKWGESQVEFVTMIPGSRLDSQLRNFFSHSYLEYKIYIPCKGINQSKIDVYFILLVQPSINNIKLGKTLN